MEIPTKAADFCGDDTGIILGDCIRHNVTWAFTSAFSAFSTSMPRVVWYISGQPQQRDAQNHELSPWSWNKVN